MQNLTVVFLNMFIFMSIYILTSYIATGFLSFVELLSLKIKALNSVGFPMIPA